MCSIGNSPPDGVKLSFTLYLPPDYKEGEKRPALLWAYPMEFTDAGIVDRIRQVIARSGFDPRRLAELWLALAAKDDRHLILTAHAFKGSGSQLGAHRLAEICQDLETRGQRMEWPGMEEVVGELQSEIDRIAPLLRARAETISSSRRPVRSASAATD